MANLWRQGNVDRVRLSVIVTEANVSPERLNNHHVVWDESGFKLSTWCFNYYAAENLRDLLQADGFAVHLQ
jgi:hypothetical protein